MLQMVEKSNANISGYHLFDFGSKWEIHGSFGIFTGSLNQVNDYAIVELGFSNEELHIGINEMRKHLHNAASYGIYKRFMFTYEKEFYGDKSIVVH